MVMDILTMTIVEHYSQISDGILMDINDDNGEI